MTIGAFNSPDATRSLNARTGPVAFAVAEPADPCRQALEGHAVLGLLDPASQRFILREEIGDRLIGSAMSCGSPDNAATETVRCLYKRASEILRHETGKKKRPLVPAELGFAANSRSFEIVETWRPHLGSPPSPQPASPLMAGRGR